MSQERFLQLKSMLQRKRRETATKRDEAEGSFRTVRKEDPHDRPKEAVDADNSSVEALKVQRVKDLDYELKQIDLALARLDRGTYGYCVDCEEEIEEKRLETKAFASRCCACERAKELREATTKGRKLQGAKSRYSRKEW